MARRCWLGIGLFLAVLGQAEAAIPMAAGKYRKEFTQAARSVFGPFAPVSALAAQVHVESAWNCNAISPASAKGCSQFIDATARAMAKNYPSLKTFDPFNPAQSFLAQSLLMLENVNRWKEGRSSCSAWIMASSDYNGGSLMLRREVNQCLSDPDCDTGRWYYHVELKNARASWAWKENRAYPTRILVLQSDYLTAGWGPGVCEP